MAKYDIEKMKEEIVIAIKSKRSYVVVDGIEFLGLPEPPYLLSEKKKIEFAEKYAEVQIKALIED